MDQVTLVLDNVRSAHNVGAILRNAAAFGVTEVVCLGITPYPKQANDSRLPHIASRATHSIAKTALGAESLLKTSHFPDFKAFAGRYPHPAFALEQSQTATPLADFEPVLPLALVLGNEVSGVAQSTLSGCSGTVEIPMAQTDESLNVAVTSGIALYGCYLKLSKAR